jgi:hypothetical protein|tara:strand:- start:1156 stop:1431 length:276 start_codon:yes stop_codon:yes gene_type:complete
MLRNLEKKHLLLINVLYLYIYKSGKVMKHETKLTSVKIIKTLYEQFKFKTVNSSMNLQKLVNRSVHQYLNNVIVKEQIENYDKLYASGSRF